MFLCLCSCLFVGHDRDPAKTTELIEPYEFRCPRNHDLDGVHIGATWRIRWLDLCDSAAVCYRYVAACCSFRIRMTRCLHFSASCTTGWVNYANEPSQAALERSSQDVYDVIVLTRAARRLCGQ